jgi:hypothetical protein
VKKKVMDAAEMARRRWSAISKEERSELGRKAANARWEKWRKAKANDKGKNE